MKYFLFALLFAFTVTSIDVAYSFEGINSSDFDRILHQYPLTSLITAVQNMEDNTELILRPFNFGATKSYEEHSGVGKNTNVKGKSCYLNDETLNGKITYIQSNAYTGRKQTDDKITYIGKYLARDKLVLPIFDRLAKANCEKWKTINVEDIKKQIVAELKKTAKSDPNLADTIEYVNQRFMFNVNISGTPYITTEIVTVANVTSNSQVPITRETCTADHKCSYQVESGQTNIVEVLAYEAFNLNTCEPKAFELVADMDIMTVHFNRQEGTKTDDLKKYFNDPTGKNCENSFKMAFGISPKIPMVYNYVRKMMVATAEWGLIRHSLEALNFCFTQPFEAEKYYLKLSRSIVGRGQITVIYEDKNTTHIKDTVRGWFLAGQCTPLNPNWLFPNAAANGAQMYNQEEVNSILKSKQIMNKCPTYDVIRMIAQDGATIPTTSVKAKIEELKKTTHHIAMRQFEHQN